MLVASERHTAADLELWNELEAADAIHACTLDSKIEAAREVVQRFATGGCCCAVSWGKDSLVVASLSVDTTPIYRVCWQASDNPDSLLVESQFCRRYPNARVVNINAPDNDHDDGRIGFRMLRDAHPKRITGIRADESASRRMSAIVHGLQTEISCRPILHWSIDDVFAYCYRFELPVHPVYAMLGGGRWSRDHLRVDSIGDHRGTGHGRREWEEEYYSDVINRLKHAAS